MTNALKAVITIGSVVLVSLLIGLLNAKKSKRVRQFPMTFISLALVITGIVLLTVFRKEISGYIAMVDFFKDMDIVLVNLAIMLGYAILKLIIRPIVSAIFKKKKTLQAFSLTLYEYDEDYGMWFLGKKWAAYRKYILGLVVGYAIATIVFLCLTVFFGSGHPIWIMVHPCAALVVLIEIYSFVNGQTKEEFEHSVMGDEADSRLVSNYYKLREILERLLPTPLLSAGSGSEFSNSETATDLLKKLEESEDVQDNIVANYFELDDRYKTANVDSVQATVDLLHNRNVVFFNPFYRDCGMYVTLPMVRALLSGKKCTIFCGRQNNSDDVHKWVSELLSEYSHMDSLWRVGILSDKEPEFEVGILNYTQIYNKNVLSTNRSFLKETSFVVLIEPSVILNTSQVALSILAEEMSDGDDHPVYCIIDRYTDALVDTLSHLLRSEITDVVAMPIPRCSYTAMSWDADGDFCRQNLFDKQTRYLGNGIELAAVAVKNQVPKVTWYSDKKSPIRDIRWIAGQYTATICKYMNLPTQQKNLYEKIDFVSNLWGAQKQKAQFVVAEDEFCNMFNATRAYLSRGTDQVFVNILSENYLLRDYMRCNRQMFFSNPNAIPSFIPDYAKTERNTLLKLILMMTLRPVSEDEVAAELTLAGLDMHDVHSTLLILLSRYTDAADSVFSLSSRKTIIDEYTTVNTMYYSIAEDQFEKYFSESLKNAYFVLEEEKDSEDYIDARLFGHVTQTILPGQFITFDGKYYQAKYVSPSSGVILRRASDLYDSRKYYRQSRHYILDLENSCEVESARTVMDIEFKRIRTNIVVNTDGYIELNDNHDLRTARTVDLSKDPSVGRFSRSYRNKSILRISMPDADERVCFTFCLLLSEVFKTTYPDGWHYIAVVTQRSNDIYGVLNYAVYTAEGGIEPGYIYIIEDSDIDLGLLDSIEKNYMKLMEVVADFLDWHFEKMKEPASKDPVPVKISIQEAEERKRRSLLTRMFDRIRKLFGGKKEEQVKLDDPKSLEDKADKEADKSPVNSSDASDPALEAEEYGHSSDSEHDPDDDDITETDKPAFSDVAEPVISEESDLEENKVEKEKKKSGSAQFSEDEFEPDSTEDPDLVHIDGTDIFDNEGMPEDNDFLELSFQEMGLTPITKTRYQRECYLKYGFEEIDGRIKVDELRQYLRVRGWCKNSLTLARKREVLTPTLLDTSVENCCDFCGLPLSGASYEMLNDGRIRCSDCSASAIQTIDDFRRLFYQCLKLMEDFYGINYKVPISVRMTDAREVAKRSGLVFKPSTGFANRVLGFAQKKNGAFSLVVENGSPRLAALDTCVHEMTHIWQYLNWKQSNVASIYRMNENDCTGIAVDIVYEGMAMWAAIQYLYQIGETYYASIQEQLAASRGDVYGVGFLLYRKQYPLVKDSSIIKYSPFASFPPLEPTEVASAVKACCCKKECKC